MKQRMTSILATVLLTASSIGAGIISAMDSKIGGLFWLLRLYLSSEWEHGQCDG